MNIFKKIRFTKWVETYFNVCWNLLKVSRQLLCNSFDIFAILAAAIQVVEQDIDTLKNL